MELRRWGWPFFCCFFFCTCVFYSVNGWNTRSIVGNHLLLMEIRSLYFLPWQTAAMASLYLVGGHRVTASIYSFIFIYLFLAFRCRLFSIVRWSLSSYHRLIVLILLWNMSTLVTVSGCHSCLVSDEFIDESIHLFLFFSFFFYNLLLIIIFKDKIITSLLCLN